jgi:hypothetical protein
LILLFHNEYKGTKKQVLLQHFTNYLRLTDKM